MVANILRVVTDEMNNGLTKEFIGLEEEQAIKQMAPSKAPRPDGIYAPCLLPKIWLVVRSNVTSAVLSCLNFGCILKVINHTFITLIPKVKNL